MTPLNSNLILLILLKLKPESVILLSFKFQSDSINTIAAQSGPMSIIPLNSNLILLILEKKIKKLYDLFTLNSNLILLILGIGAG